MRFDGKVAIVTGGTGGIGRAIATLIASESGKVLIANMAPDSADLATAMKADGLEAEFLELDINREDQVAKMVETTVDRWG